MKSMIIFWGRINFATRLTIMRIALVPLFMVLMFWDDVYARIGALLVFIGAMITDLYDGHIARRTKTITVMGTFLDPLADKLMISAVFISFVENPELKIPAWMVVCIISREFIITGLRSIAASRGIILAADKHGKFKTSTQVTVIIMILVILIINTMLEQFWNIRMYQWVYALDWRQYIGNSLMELPYWLMLIATVLTLYSGMQYLKKNWDVISERRKTKR